MQSIASPYWHMLNQLEHPEKTLSGVDAIYHNITGKLKRMIPNNAYYLRCADTVLSLQDTIVPLSDSDLKTALSQAAIPFTINKQTPKQVQYALALVREVAYRTIGEMPYREQIAGAIALIDNHVIEMATGEGKTLTSALAATLLAWHQQGCHILTVNDYLAKRDAQWMGQIYDFCNITVDYIQQSDTVIQRQKAYSAHITYTTNKEVAADFLRDRLKIGNRKRLSDVLISQISTGDHTLNKQLVHRGFNYVIIDEADSILIDEAVTPLLISGASGNQGEINAFQQAAKIALLLSPNIDYDIDLRHQEIKLTEAGTLNIKGITASMGSFWRGQRRSHEMIRQALTAKTFYLKNKQYAIEDGKIVIIDELTGRLMHERSWRDGLHQAIEAKEQLKIQSVKETYARISFQKFYKMYKHLSGMTGTALEARNEFWQIYKKTIVVIPPHKQSQRKQMRAVLCNTDIDKWDMILREIKKVHLTDRPILVGTRSVKSSQHISDLLSKNGLTHVVLNAINHQLEAEIISVAGEAGKITVATNMAGRGTDIKLDTHVAQNGGLYVIATEVNDSFRVDRQLFGRCGRQGDPGTTQAIFSLEDELITKWGYDIQRLIKKWPFCFFKHGPFMQGLIIRVCQNRISKASIGRRKAVTQMDNWLSNQLGFANNE